MTPALRAALAAAEASFRPCSRTEQVRLPASKAAPSVLRRLAVDAPLTVQPVAFGLPSLDTDTTVRAFVVAEFAEASRKRRRAA